MQSSTKISTLLGIYYRDHLNLLTINNLAKSIKSKLYSLNENESREVERQKELLKNTEKSSTLQKKADEILSRHFPGNDEVKEAQKLYQRAKKLRRSVKTVNQRLKHHKQKLMIIKGSEVFLEDLINSTWEGDQERIQMLAELDKEVNDLLLPNHHKIQNKYQKSKITSKALQLKSPAGLTIQVGRNHQQNDWISIRQAKSGDIWFHAQESPGSHVVLKASSGLAEEEDIKLAAHLAAHFSRARGNRFVPIIMTSTDNLKKIPGAQAGVVQHQNSKVIWGEPEKARKYISFK